jgi:hypothetical protein
MGFSLSSTIENGRDGGGVAAAPDVGMMPPIYWEEITTTRIEITDDSGAVTGYDDVTSGPGYTSTMHYDVALNYLGEDYVDSWGYHSSSRQTTLTDGTGTVTGYRVETEAGDDYGTYAYTEVYDADWFLLESQFSDSSGYTSSTTQTITRDAAGTVLRYDMVSTGTGPDYSYSSSSSYDGNWNLIAADYSDSMGYTSRSTRTILTNADGSVAGYVLESSGSSDGYSYSSTERFDADYQLVSSEYSDGSGYRSTYAQETERAADGTITGYTITSTWTDGTDNYSSVNHYDANWMWLDGEDGGSWKDDGGPRILPVIALSADVEMAEVQDDGSTADSSDMLVSGDGNLNLGKGGHAGVTDAGLTGTDDLKLSGNRLDNVLAGNAGDNRLNGKGGSDSLFGGVGADIFVFDRHALKDTDTVVDFTAGEDQIALDGRPFKGLFEKGGSLKADAWGDALRLEDGALVFNGKDGDVTIALVGTAALDAGSIVAA